MNNLQDKNIEYAVLYCDFKKADLGEDELIINLYDIQKSQDFNTYEDALQYKHSLDGNKIVVGIYKFENGSSDLEYPII